MTTQYVLMATQGQGGAEVGRYDTVADLRVAYESVRGDASLGIRVLPEDRWIPGDQHEAFLAAG